MAWSGQGSSREATPKLLTNGNLPSAYAGSITPRSRPTLYPIRVPPQAATVMTRCPSNVSANTLYSRYSDSTEESYSNSEGVIHISPAYYDEHDVEGPATTTIPCEIATPVDEPGGKNCRQTQAAGNNPFGATASFIPAFELPSEDVEKGGHGRYDSIAVFDFDTLPARPPPNGSVSVPPPSVARGQMEEAESSVSDGHVDVLYIQARPSKDQGKWDIPGILRRIQTKCNINRWLLVTEDTNAIAHPFTQSSFSAHNSSLSDHDTKLKNAMYSEEQEEITKKRFKLVQAVPAFSSPLTHVLSPVIVRGQWEIVIRSTLIALLFSWIIIGALLSVPG